MNLSVTVIGSEQLDRKFAQIARKVSDLRDVWPDVLTAVLEIQQDQFRAGGRGRSGAWKELSPKYEEQKGRKYNFMPILQRTRALYNSLTRKGAEHQIFESDEKSMTIGTDLPYARFHQEGKGKLPARPIFDFTPEDERKIVRSARKGLVKYASELGFTQTTVGAFD